MKGLLKFDPDDYDYGVASMAIRALLKEWADVDWFVPGANEAARVRAMRLFEEHHVAAHHALPEVFGPKVEIRTRYGGWNDFHALYEMVSEDVRYRAGQPGRGWDWKFEGLKQMTSAHSEARGLDIESQARLISAEYPPQPGELFFRLPGSETGFIWSSPFPDLELRSRLPANDAAVANWYVGYANMDAMEAIEWQLAERSNDLTTNPFVPLLRVYAEGFLPFSLARNEVVLFAFSV